MSPAGPPDGPGEETPAARRRRLAAVFGEVLPETTGDERSDEDESRAGRDDWLRAQVPPHHAG